MNFRNTSNARRSLVWQTATRGFTQTLLYTDANTGVFRGASVANGYTTCIRFGARPVNSATGRFWCSRLPTVSIIPNASYAAIVVTPVVVPPASIHSVMFPSLVVHPVRVSLDIQAPAATDHWQAVSRVYAAIIRYCILRPAIGKPQPIPYAIPKAHGVLLSTGFLDSSP